MARKRTMGEWCFLGGVILAILAGFVDLTWIPAVLIVLGLLVGFMNITEKETESFLLAAVGLLLVGTAGLGAIPLFGLEGTLESILTNIATFVAPGVLVVALKTIWELGKKK